MFAIVGCFAAVLAVAVLGDNCPSGGEIYSRGISDQGRIDVLNAHNAYRQQIMDGTVPDQPRGRDLKTLIYDTQLGEEGRVVSDTCTMQHINAQDSRWRWVGQNLYIAWSSGRSTNQNWQAAVTAWFNEYRDFTYPNISRGVTGHYTQVIWANTEYVGCDFIAFYDTNQPRFPYAKLYTCNYGPGGNIRGQAPYPLA